MPKLSKVKLTKRFVDALKWPPADMKPGQRDALFFDSETRGFGVRLTKADTRTFLVRYTDRVTKAKRQMALGEYGAVTIEEARSHARAILGEAVIGDPVGRLRAERATVEAARQADVLTVEALIEMWAKRHLAKRRESYRTEIVASIRRTLPGLLPLSAVTLSKAAVMSAIDAALAGTHRAVLTGRAAICSREAAAAKALAGCRAMFNWALKADLVTKNPFEGLPFTPAHTVRDRWLDDAELGAVYLAASAIPYPFGPYFRTLILTGQRKNEVAGMRWSEVNIEKAEWTMPANRQKNSKPHIVHLSPPAIAALRIAAEHRQEGSDFVFTTTGRTPISGLSMAKADLDARSGVADWTNHDLRRTLATGVAALGLSVEAAGKILAHKAGLLRGIERVYQQFEFLKQRREALDAWGAHVVACAAAATAAGSKAGSGVAPGRSALLARRRRALELTGGVV